MKILLLNQCFYPDVVATAQQLTDLAKGLAERGHDVTVVSSDRGYDDPAIRYPRRETREGVRIMRLPWSSLGKRSMIVRLAGGLSFIVQATLRALFTRRLGCVVVTTVPVMSPVAGAALALTSRANVVYWIMDLNPDQLVALGVVRKESLLVRALDWCNVALLRRATAVIVCDEYMAERVRGKFDPGGRLHIATPWAHDQHLESVPHDANPFRLAHVAAGRRAVMYSGNHALTNPLATLLDAAAQLADDPRLTFLFVGGGAGKKDVESRQLPNVMSLPYQALDQLKYSLSAADVHVVTIGAAVVGIVHPCKIYGAMAVGRAVLAFGPRQSHVADIVAQGIGWHLEHGDVEGAVATLRLIADLPRETLDEMGARGQTMVREKYDGRSSRSRVCDMIEASQR